MNRLILSLSIFLIVLQGIAQPGDPKPLKVGAAQLDSYIDQLRNRSVGLVVNQTSMIGDTHLVDKLRGIEDIHIKTVFAPEHGFRGTADAGEKVIDGVDSKTGLPIISLYGANRKPNVEQLKGIDVLVFDIQDVGTRFYTYISTMHYIMEAGAENDLPVIVLDRPNPNGMYVDGPVRDEELKSFVGMHPIPIVHGLTVGELAQMINGEGWLQGGLKCDLTVVPVKNYTHTDNYSLPVKPSPNLPNDLAIKLYPSLCLFEGTVISVGRGTDAPFQQIGHPDFNMDYSFTPDSTEGAKYPRYEGEACHGIDFSQQDVEYSFTLKYLIDFHKTYDGKEPFFNNFFDKLAGTASLQKQIKEGLSEGAIRKTWEEDLANYKTMRKKYLLYPDFE